MEEEQKKKSWESENPEAVREAVQGSKLFDDKKDQEAKPVASPVPAKPSEQSNAVAAVGSAQPTPAQRFTAAAEREFSAINGNAVQLTDFQRRLIQSYFIKIDMVLAEAERKRLAKDEKWRDAVPVTWQNVNMQRLAVDVIAYSAIGLDPAQPNHINPIPYKNNGTGKYDITFTMGYRGIELKSRKYGLDVPDDVVVNLVYANDTFEEIKKDIDHPIESYRFVVNDSFDRGELRGGFYYHLFTDHPERNKIRVFNKSEIDKRKPDKASAEFWGGEKDVWKDGKRTGKEQIEGWYDEMAYKTIYRAAYNDITIDSAKIDENLWKVIELESSRRNDHALEERDAKVATVVGSQTIRTEDVSFEEVKTEALSEHTSEIGDAMSDAEPPYAKKQ